MTDSGFFLLDHPNPHGQHFYTTRLGHRVLAIGVHITAGLQDLVGADLSAEQTAQYCATTDRDVSWTAGSDGDSHLRLLPDGYTAWAIHNYNKVTWNHEISLREPDWRKVPAEARERLLRNAAKEVGPAMRRLHIPFRHATKRELDEAIAAGASPVGAIAHAVLDPERRRDPGIVVENGRWVDTFPWDEFLTYCREYAYIEEDELTPEDWTRLDALVRDAVKDEVETLLTKTRGEYITHKPISIANQGAHRYAHWALDILQKAHPDLAEGTSTK